MVTFDWKMLALFEYQSLCRCDGVRSMRLFSNRIIDIQKPTLTVILIHRCDCQSVIVAIFRFLIGRSFIRIEGIERLMKTMRVQGIGQKVSQCQSIEKNTLYFVYKYCLEFHFLV